jgi:polygalacturonase
MRWCSSKRGHGGLVIGSEMSGDVRNVYMHDCDFDGTDRAVRIKARRGRGGVVANVWVENVRVKNMQYEVVIMNMDYSADRNRVANERAPLFRNIHLKNITADGAPVAIRLTGLDDSLIQGITFADMTIASTQGVIAEQVQGLRFERVRITPAKGPAFALANARDVVISQSPSSAATLLSVSGAGSKGIVVESSGPTPPVVTTGPGVAAGAVQVR